LLHIIGVQTGLSHYGLNLDSILMAVLHLVSWDGTEVPELHQF